MASTGGARCYSRVCQLRYLCLHSTLRMNARNSALTTRLTSNTGWKEALDRVDLQDGL